MAVILVYELSHDDIGATPAGSSPLQRGMRRSTLGKSDLTTHPVSLGAADVVPSWSLSKAQRSSRLSSPPLLAAAEGLVYVLSLVPSGSAPVRPASLQPFKDAQAVLVVTVHMLCDIQ